MLCAACLFQGCPPGPLLSGQLMSCPYFCFPLSTSSSLVLFLLMLSFFSSWQFPPLFWCLLILFTVVTPQHSFSPSTVWPYTGHASRTFAFTHRTDPPFPVLTSCCAPPDCSFFSLGTAFPSSLQPALCTVLAAALIEQSSHPASSRPPAAHGPVPFSLLLLSLLYSMIFPHKWLPSHSALHGSALAWCLLRVFLCWDHIHTPSPHLHPAVVANEQLWNCLLHIFSAYKW